MNPSQAKHYLSWADSFYAETQSSVGYVEGTLFHCWHGEIADRRYLERHIEFAKLGFDPGRDIELNSDGLWVWTSDGMRHEPFVRDYFAARKEDTVHLPSGPGGG